MTGKRIRDPAFVKEVLELIRDVAFGCGHRRASWLGFLRAGIHRRHETFGGRRLDHIGYRFRLHGFVRLYCAGRTMLRADSLRIARSTLGN